MTHRTQLDVMPPEDGMRLDRYLVDQLSDLSRSRLQRMIKDGLVLVNDEPARASYRVSAGDTVAVRVPEDIEPEPVAQPIPIDILYQDDALMVVNKPAGQVVHTAPGHLQDTLVNALLYHRPELGESGLDPLRPGIVHRLDRDTSGVLVVATQVESLEALQRQFRRREVDKRYLALVYGLPVPLRAAIEAPIARDPGNRKRMAVTAKGGRYARTEYTVTQEFAGASLLEVTLITGRTHQVRVHLASIGYPVVGDRTYGRRRQIIDAPRQMLHAWRLVFRHPFTEKEMAFEAPLPADFQDVLDDLKRQR